MKPNLPYWQSVLRKARRQFGAATGRTTLNKKLMRAEAELKRREALAGAST